MKRIIWVVFFMTFACLLRQDYLLKRSEAGMVDLQFSNAAEGAAIIQSWQSNKYGDQTLLEIARSNVKLDYFFIFQYLIILIMISNSQMQRERNLRINIFLRFNIFLAALISILDVFENILLLHNLHHPGDIYEFWDTRCLAFLKFLLLAWVVGTWLISITKLVLQPKKRYVVPSIHS